MPNSAVCFFEFPRHFPPSWFLTFILPSRQKKSSTFFLNNIILAFLTKASQFVVELHKRIPLLAPSAQQKRLPALGRQPCLLLIVLQRHRHHPAHALFLHRHPEQAVTALHRPLAVRHHNELRTLRVFLQIIRVIPDIRVIQRGFNLVQNAVPRDRRRTGA